jgi:uncharacterized protein YbjQ (UPF0145 family)
MSDGWIELLSGFFWIFIQVGPVIFLLALGLFVGGWNERRHIRSLDRREKELKHMVINNLKRITAPDSVTQSNMVLGSVVIASDYLKSFLTSLRALVGGEMRSMQSLLIRARREAIVRMLEQAVQMGATEVWNVRLEFCSISQMRGKRGAASVEIIAYGTAVKRA